MSALEIVLLAVLGFFAGYGIACAENDAEGRRRREERVWSDFIKQALRGGIRK